MTVLKQKNTNRQGLIGVSAAIKYFVREGFTVSLPIDDSQTYDLIAVKAKPEGGKDVRFVQVKTTTQVSRSYSGFIVELRVSGKKDGEKPKKDDFTHLYVVDANENEYMIPFDDVSQSTSFTLKERHEKYIVKVAGIWL